MKNVKFCYPNWVLPSSVISPAITGTGWIDLSKMQGAVLSEMARYPGVTPADTKFVVDLGTTRNIDTLVLPFHNAKIGDTARVEVATDTAFTDIVLDSGWKEFFGEMYPFGSLEWGRVEWLDGRLTEEQIEGLVLPWMHIASTTVFGRYVRWSLDFSGNSDGFVDVGQPVVAQALSPVYNVSYGCIPPFYRDTSVKSRAKGGPQFKDRRKKFRVSKMSLDWLSASELYGQFYEMVRNYGTTEPFFFIYDADATGPELVKQSFMATADRIGDPTHPRFETYSLPIEISEEF